MISLNEFDDNDLDNNNSFDLTSSLLPIFPQDDENYLGGEDLNRDIEEGYSGPMDKSNKNLLEEEKNKIEEVPTSSITILSKINNSKINSEKKVINPFYNFKDIPNNLSSKVNINKEISKIICDNNNIIKEDKNFHLLNKKRKEEINFSENVCIYDNKENAKKTFKRRGRITTKSQRKVHNNMSSDNIINKIKGKLFKKCLNFINNIINEFYTGEKKIELLPINYKYIKRLKKEIDINILNTQLKDLYSKEISPKYRSQKQDYNKKIIDKIINKNSEMLSDYSTIEFVFDMTFKEWLNLFTSKESIDTFCKFKKCEQNTIDIIKKYIVGLDTFLINEAAKTKDENYFLSFKSLLYNYENYFLDKKSRK